MFTTLRRATRESARGHGSSASALRAVPAGSASSPRPRARGTGIVEDPAERAIAEARQPSQDRVFPPPHQLSRRPSFTHLRTHTYARSLRFFRLYGAFFTTRSLSMTLNRSSCTGRVLSVFVIIFGGNLCVFLDFNAIQYIKLPFKNQWLIGSNFMNSHKYMVLYNSETFLHNRLSRGG